MTDLREPILRGIAHPHTALTPEQLAQVRLDLELAEPKPCNFRFWFKGEDGEPKPLGDPCGKTAVQQSLLVCGHVSYRCTEHVQTGETNPITGEPITWQYCPYCNTRSPMGEHVVARMPL